MNPDDAYNRRLVPLLVIDEGTKASPWFEGRTKLAKIVFLIRQLEPHSFWDVAGPGGEYDFVPHYYGPFSKELLKDVERLEAEGLIEVHIEDLDSHGKISEYWYRPTQKGKKLLDTSILSQGAAQRIRQLVAHYAAMTRSQLVEYVYEKFPNFVPK